MDEYVILYYGLDHDVRMFAIVLLSSSTLRDTGKSIILLLPMYRGMYIFINDRHISRCDYICYSHAVAVGYSMSNNNLC